MQNLKTAVLTGANGQIGTAFLKCLIQEGYQVYALDINTQRIQDDPPHVISRAVDITSEEQVKGFFDSLPSLDLLVNNAGIGVFTPFEERTLEELDRVIRVNLLGTILMCREAILKMKPQRKGKIVNIGSIYGQVSSDPGIYGQSGRMNSEVYSATKAGVIMLSKYLAAHYAKDHIQINTLSPGGVFNQQTPDFLKEYCRKTPAGRMAGVEDLLPAFKCLISAESDYLTGQNITVDGGFTAW